MTEAMTARLKPIQPGKASLVSVLDIGSTKICCIIARLNPRPEGKALKGRTHSVEIIGFGYGNRRGLQKLRAGSSPISTRPESRPSARSSAWRSAQPG